MFNLLEINIPPQELQKALGAIGHIYKHFATMKGCIYATCSLYILQVNVYVSACRYVYVCLQLIVLCTNNVQLYTCTYCTTRGTLGKG